ncbi:unnamed protein product, partial [Polarella glacialis]
VKLGDFGIARVLDHTTSKAKTAVGTPYYASPEVCDSQPYGFKADVWAMGVVLHELMALEQPFKGPSLVALVLRIIQSEPAPLPDTYSEEARDVCLQALRKNPEERPSACQLLELPAVRQATEQLEQRSPLPCLLYPVTPSSSRRLAGRAAAAEVTAPQDELFVATARSNDCLVVSGKDLGEFSGSVDAVDTLMAALLGGDFPGLSAE